MSVLAWLLATNTGSGAANAAQAADEHGAGVLDTIGGWWRLELFAIEGRAITVGAIIVFVLLLILGGWAARLTSRIVAGVLRRRFSMNEGAVAAIRAILFYVLVTIVVLLALRIVNIPLTIFAVIGGALAIGIGLGSQNVVNNFISGLILLIERPIRVGDIVELEDHKGIVRQIGARAVRVQRTDQVDIVVPNSMFLENTVTNWSLTGANVRGDVAVGVAYGSDVGRVREILTRSAVEHAKILEDPEPVTLFEDFGDSALLFRVYFWTRVRRPFELRLVRSDLRFAIDAALREAQITIAFPQRDVHLFPAQPIEVRMTQGSSEKG